MTKKTFKRFIAVELYYTLGKAHAIFVITDMTQ